MIKMFRGSSFLLLLAWLSQTCASEMPRVISKTQFPGLALDTSALSFVDLETQKTVVLKEYMERNNLDSMLMIYGSAGCVKCSEKSRELSHDYRSSHSLFLSPSFEKFGLMGITTDQGSSIKLFMSRWANPAQKYEWGYDYIYWNDPGGDTVKDYFLQPDEPFQVPFAVLIHRDRIVWRLTASEKLSVKEMLDQVQLVLKGEQLERSKPTHKPPGPRPQTPLPENPQSPVSTLSPWMMEAPERFDDFPAINCQGQQEKINLSETEVRLVYYRPADCVGECQADLLQLEALQSMCVTHTDFDSGALPLCGLSVVSAESWRQNGECSQKRYQDLYSELSISNVYRSLFDYAEVPTLDSMGLPIRKQSFERSVLLGFDGAGKLIMAHQGVLDKDTLYAELSSSGLSERPKTANFKILGDDRQGVLIGNHKFNQVTASAELTIVAGFDVMCGSCVEELQHWSVEDGLFDYCQKKRDVCQIFALETYPPFIETPQQMYQEIKKTMRDLSIKVPLWVDREKFNGEFSRFFESYLSPLNPDWRRLPGTTIFDREGKIVASFASGSERSSDPVEQVARYYEALGKYRKFIKGEIQ
jgi:hypothetical protein